MNPSTLFGRLLDDGADHLTVRASDGDVWSMPMGRWLAPATEVDERVLDRALGPVLDVGCGPGRHVHALSRRGIVALGIELSPTAVRHARDGGADVLEGSIFEVAPDPGLWSTALLLDGNIGIGGHPGELLGRIGGLLSPNGRVLVELDPAVADPCPVPHVPRAGGPVVVARDSPLGTRPDTGAPIRVRIESDGTTSAWFPWARVAADAIDAPADQADMHVAERWSDGGRYFCTLARS